MFKEQSPSQFSCCLSSLSDVKSALAKERLGQLAGDLEPVTHVEQFSYQAEGAELQIHASHLFSIHFQTDPLCEKNHFNPCLAISQ